MKVNTDYEFAIFLDYRNYVCKPFDIPSSLDEANSKESLDFLLYLCDDPDFHPPGWLFVRL